MLSVAYVDGGEMRATHELLRRGRPPRAQASRAAEVAAEQAAGGEHP